MTECIDPTLGDLLSAYELGALSEEDEKRLEIHLMQCEHCLNEVSAFQRYADVLRDSKKIREAMTRQARSTQRSVSARTLIQYLWPDVPLIFKPAVTILLVLLMIVPSFVGLRVLTGDDADIRPVQMIRLIPIRSAGASALSIGSGLDATISFGVPDYAPGKFYDVAVIDDQGEAVVRLASFGSINERGMGQIVFPHQVMKPGTYHLIVTCADSESEHIYTFVIEP